MAGLKPGACIRKILDIVTRGMLAWVLARGLFPRRGWPVAAGMILAGILADLDGLSSWFGPAAYLKWHRTYTHSMVGSLVIAAICIAVALRLGKKKAVTEAVRAVDAKAVAQIALAIGVAILAHLLMDLGQSDGVTFLWPLASTRFSADILPGVDAWILGLLILGIVAPELFRLVGSEIGAKDRNPRGQNGARVVLALLLIYSGARYVLHTNALAELDAHVYKGESPRRVGAFADALSVFTWHGVAETQSLMCTVEVAAGQGRQFDAEAAYCQHKPEPSAALEVAEKTTVAQAFLRVARFPKATVEKRDDGYEVLIRAVQNEGESEIRQRVAARILLDGKTRVLEQELVWARDLGRR